MIEKNHIYLFVCRCHDMVCIRYTHGGHLARINFLYHVGSRERNSGHQAQQQTHLLTELSCSQPPPTPELQTFSSMLNAYLYMRTLCRSVCDPLMEAGSMELDQREAGLGMGRKPMRQSKLQLHCGLIRWDPVSIPRINFCCPVITVYFCHASPANSIPQQH